MVISTLNYVISSIYHIDKMFNVRERTWQFMSHGMNKLTQVDQHYQLHQIVTDIVYTAATAILKAGIAYTEAPSYNEVKKCKTL